MSFLSSRIVLESEKKDGSNNFGPNYYLSSSSRRQRIEPWLYDGLRLEKHHTLEWISFFVIDEDVILELRSYLGDCYRNTAIHFLFRNKTEAEKFLLPQWAKGSCIKETTGLPLFSERGLAESGFSIS